MAKKTTITIETKSWLVMRSRTSREVWCPVCAATTEMIALQDTGMISNFDRVALEQWLNSGELHQVEAEDSLLICLNSLLAHVQNIKRLNCGIPRTPKTGKERT